MKPNSTSTFLQRLLRSLFVFTLTSTLTLTFFSLPGCGSARRSEPVVGPLRLTSADAIHGEKVFMAKCHQCHPGGEAGLGPAINNKPLPDFLVRLQVRKGFGAMPGFTTEQLTDEELAHVLVYLHELADHG